MSPISKSITKNSTNKHSGFTLLELLIVIAIIAILSVVLVIVLNPSEALKKSRDTQRMSDLATIKIAIGIYTVNTSSPVLAGVSNVGCKGTASDEAWTNSDYIYYSYPNGIPITDKTLDGTTFTTGGASQVSSANLGLSNGSGWLPINLSSITGGSPISSLPVDPVNTIADPSKPTYTDLVYRYVCLEKDFTYEIDATLESEAYTITDNKMVKDGGNNDLYYEVGTNLKVFNEENSAENGGSGGLTWASSDAPGGYMDWYAGDAYCSGLGSRLPSSDELVALYSENGGTPPSFGAGYYWSGTTLPTGASAYIVDMYGGGVYDNFQDDSNYVHCVR